jgi:Na+/alanine symporter
MKEYFKPTGRKILGVIILILLFSFIIFFISYTAEPSKFFTGDNPILIGWPLVFISIGGNEATNNFNIVNLIIDIIIFYFVTCILAIIFKGRKKENVPNSNSGGRDTSPANQTQPGN